MIVLDPLDFWLWGAASAAPPAPVVEVRRQNQREFIGEVQQMTHDLILDTSMGPQ